MAVPYPGMYVLTLLCVLGVTGASDPYPACSPVCREGNCPVKLTKIDSEECECRQMFSTNPNPNPGPKTPRLVCKNDSVRVKLPKNLRGGETTLVLYDRDQQRICYDVQRKNQGNNKTTTKKLLRIRIRCSHKDELMLQSIFLLNNYIKYKVNSTGSTCCTENPVVIKKTPATKGCKCWSPNRVVIQPLNNSTLMVKWNPFYAHKDIRVRIEVVKSSNRNFNRDEILPNYQLCLKKLRNYTFTNFEPGTYYAEVGSLGCDCMVYKRSDQITIPDHNEVIVDNSLIPSPSHAPVAVTREHNDYTTAVIAIVGALAVIGVTSLGITLYLRKRRTYGPVEQTVELLETDEGNETTQILILQDKSDKTKSVATLLKTLIGKEDTKVISKDQFHPNRIHNELVVLVSLQDIHTFQTPPVTPSHGSNTITVLMDYTKTSQPALVVHVPAGIKHSSFREFVDNNDLPETVLSLQEAVQCINPEFDVNGCDNNNLVHDINESLRPHDGDMKNILLLSGYVHDHHNKACLELAKMLRDLNPESRISYAFEEDNRKEHMRHGPVQWTIQQVGEADLVVVVVSKFLYKLLECFTKEKELSESITNLALCAPLALVQLSERTNRPRIVFVTFGYESNYVEEIVKLKPLLQSDLRYDLVENKRTVLCQEDNNYEHHALEIFLSRFSADNSRVQRVSSNSETFFEHVQAMAAVMANDRKWLSTAYGSMVSLKSFLSMSTLSLASRGMMQGMYASSGHHVETTYMLDDTRCGDDSHADRHTAKRQYSEARCDEAMCMVPSTVGGTYVQRHSDWRPCEEAVTNQTTF